MTLILASQSEGRKALLSTLNIPFEIIPSCIDEDKIIASTPLITIKLRAKLKAEAILTQLTTYNLQPTTILSADSGAILNNKLIGKPKDYQDAIRIFQSLSGTTHKLVTAVFLISQIGPISQIRQDVDTSYVTFRKLAKKTIIQYLSTSSYQKYAGGYAVPLSAIGDNAYSSSIIARIEGSISNVIGLPLEKIIPILRKIRLLENKSLR